MTDDKIPPQFAAKANPELRYCECTKNQLFPFLYGVSSAPGRPKPNHCPRCNLRFKLFGVVE